MAVRNRSFISVSLRLDSTMLNVVSSMKDTVAAHYWLEQVLVRLQLATMPRNLAAKAHTVLSVG